MGDFKKDSGSNSRDFRRNDRNGPRKPLEMHKAVCDSCKSNCEIPFKPTGSKPVLCSDCFKKNSPANPRGRTSPSSDYSSEFKLIHEKLDAISKALQIGVSKGMNPEDMIVEKRERKKPSSKVNTDELKDVLSSTSKDEPE